MQSLQQLLSTTSKEIQERKQFSNDSSKTSLETVSFQPKTTDFVPLKHEGTVSSPHETKTEDLGNLSNVFDPVCDGRLPAKQLHFPNQTPSFNKVSNPYHDHNSNPVTPVAFGNGANQPPLPKQGSLPPHCQHAIAMNKARALERQAQNVRKEAANMSARAWQAAANPPRFAPDNF